jgi:hypothetical protein
VHQLFIDISDTRNIGTTSCLTLGDAKERDDVSKIIVEQLSHAQS